MIETLLPAYSDVLQAAARIAPYTAPTPLLRSHTLDTLSGAQLMFKAEHLQRSGAFKFRGACNAVWALPAETAAHGVVTHSSGNHGAALALAARTRGIGCHVVVPEGAVAAKLANISRHGATLWRCAPTIAAREQLCAEVQASSGATLVHPYTDPAVIAGQGTATLELLHDSGGLDVLVAPVGGGGLASGAALALQASPGCALVLAEPAGAADTARSLAAGQRLVDFVPDTVCDGLRGTLGAPNFALLQAAGAQVITVDDAAVVQAMRLLWQVLKQVVEPSSAIALAAVLADPARFAGKRVGDRDQAAPADVIIVLGAAAYDARPSPVFEERIRHALDLYARGYAPHLLFTGGFGNGARFAESQVARRYALRHGVPSEAIVIETSSRTTRQNLLQARALMERHGMHRAIIVSDPLHMARALRLCQELGVDALASSTPSTRFRSFHTSWRFLLQEVYYFHRDLVVQGA